MYGGFQGPTAAELGVAFSVPVKVCNAHNPPVPLHAVDNLSASLFFSLRCPREHRRLTVSSVREGNVILQKGSLGSIEAKVPVSTGDL